MHPAFLYQQYLATNPYPRKLKIYSSSLLDFSSNDYLGLAKHPLLIEQTKMFTGKYGVGSSSSRSVSGNTDIYEMLEHDLAYALGKPAALIIGTGYQTNYSVLEALLDPCDSPRVFADRFCHASIFAGIKNFKTLTRFHHNDLHYLKKKLESVKDASTSKFIVAESLYSMDGDLADLSTLIQHAKVHQALIYIDDAHAVGMMGQNGWGCAREYASEIDIVMGTFSKALGSFGGYVACSTEIKNYLINKCKGLIYSTALPPGVLGAIDASIKLIPSLSKERERVNRLGHYVREFFTEHQLNFGKSTTHIIPWILGDAEKTVKASHLLLEQGILGAPIRPPTVPTNQCRIRFCLSAAHTDVEVEQLLNAIKKVALLL